MLRVAIIGAGFSGMVLANQLQKIANVKIFEKARGVGGRMSARYVENFSFDHGLQYFTAQNSDFLEFVTSCGAAIWQGEVANLTSEKSRFESYLVATPNMNGLCKKLAQNFEIQFGAEVVPFAAKKIDGWHLFDKNSNALGVFDLVISTAPLAQTQKLFGKEIKSEKALPCFALMLGFSQPNLLTKWIFAEVENNPIKSIAVNSSKPNRNKAVSCFVAHSTNAWAADHLEDDILEVQKKLINEFELLTKIDCSSANYIATHRWRYSVVLDEKKSAPFFDADLGLAATSDWVSNSQLEDVWSAAMSLAKKIAAN